MTGPVAPQGSRECGDNLDEFERQVWLGIRDSLLEEANEMPVNSVVQFYKREKLRRIADGITESRRLPEPKS